jgi:hypothetical protein
MAITVIQRPNQEGVLIASAVGNPVLYVLERRDFTFNQINNSGGFIQLQFNSVDLTTSIANGDRLYIKSNNSVYDLFATVTAVSFSTNTLVTVDVAYISAAPGGFVNTDRRQNYYLEVELYQSGGGIKLIDHLFKYKPNSRGIINVDVSSLLKSLMSANTTFSHSSFNQNYQDFSTSFKNFHIRYREVWTGSAESQTSDSSNVINAINASQQINPGGTGGYLTVYSINGSTKQFLTKNKVKNIKLNAPLDFLNFNSSPNYISLNIGAVTLFNSINNAPALASSRITATLFHSKTHFLYFSNWQLGTGTDWGNPSGRSFSITIAELSSSKRRAIPIIVNTAGSVTISYLVSVGNYRGNGGVFTISARDVDDNSVVSSGFPITGNGNYEGQITLSLTTAVKLLTVQVSTGTGVGSGNQSVSVIFLSVQRTRENYTVRQVEVPAAIPVVFNNKSEEILVNTLEPCNNDVTLMWTNSLGGLEQHTFPYNQEMEYVNDQGRRFKEILLYDQDLSIDQWEVLNELMSPKEPFKNNILQLTSSTFKTDSIDNQQVYLIRSDLTKIGVIVIPQTNTTRTKRSKHDISIRIRLPEYYL